MRAISAEGAPLAEHSKKQIRLALVSPFLDKSHGTERTVIEWIANLGDHFEVHAYSQRVQDMDLSRITWHRVPKLPGPHLFNFIWWFAANHIRRAWDRHFGDLKYDLIFSPGINCLDADVISVHIIFAEYVWNGRSGMRFRKHPLSMWTKLLHRRLYYRLAIWLERRVYRGSTIPLILYARKTATDLKRFYGRHDDFPVLYLGLDHDTFNSANRNALRSRARKELGICRDRFALLLVGNDWRNKGVLVLLESLARLREMPIDLLLVSREDPAPVRSMAFEKGLGDRIRILPPRKDVEFYYAAADTYTGPSLGDTFALPPAEAMACGLPVIVSSANGTSEIITHGVDGLILNDPHDAAALSGMIRRLYEDPEFARKIGERAAQTARKYTWEQNGRELASIFESIVRKKTCQGRTP